MKKILFYANNLPDEVVKSFDKVVNIDLATKITNQPNFDIDIELSELLENNLSSEKYDVIYITYSLNPNNFLELSGLLLAIHIRLTKKMNYEHVPIVFIGFEEPLHVLKLSNLGTILTTPGVFTINKISVDNIKDQCEQIKNNKPRISEEDYAKFLEKLNINPPANYDSHHSIDNEYALIRWSKYIGCYDKLPDQFRKEFDSRLYFKYLNAKNKVEQIEDKINYSIALTSETKILLIDDEEQKGWGVFYKSFFQHSPKIKFACSEIDFKDNQNQDDLLSKIKNKVEAEKPDIVLLDLRLFENDFEEITAPEKITGIKAIEIIKEINRGIQVIVTTASNKAWNFNLAKQKGAFDFIIKDGFDEPEKSIKQLQQTIEICAKRSKFLKPISENIVLAINSWNNYNIPKRKNLTDEMHDNLWHIAVKQNVIDFLDNTFCTIDSENQKERFTISILLLYRTLELMKEFFIYQTGDYKSKTIEYFWDQDNSKIPKIIFNNGKYSCVEQTKGEILSTLNQLYAVYYNIHNSFNDNLFNGLFKLNRYRNEIAIHPDKRFKEESLEYKYDNDFDSFCNDLTTYFKAVCDFVSSFK